MYFTNEPIKTYLVKYVTRNNKTVISWQVKETCEHGAINKVRTMEDFNWNYEHNSYYKRVISVL